VGDGLEDEFGEAEGVGAEVGSGSGAGRFGIHGATPYHGEGLGVWGAAVLRPYKILPSSGEYGAFHGRFEHVVRITLRVLRYTCDPKLRLKGNGRAFSIPAQQASDSGHLNASLCGNYCSCMRQRNFESWRRRLGISLRPCVEIERDNIRFGSTINIESASYGGRDTVLMWRLWTITEGEHE
jgi:hypothetical protein